MPCPKSKKNAKTDRENGKNYSLTDKQDRINKKTVELIFELGSFLYIY